MDYINIPSSEIRTHFKSEIHGHYKLGFEVLGIEVIHLTHQMLLVGSNIILNKNFMLFSYNIRKYSRKIRIKLIISEKIFERLIVLDDLMKVGLEIETELKL